MKIPTDRVIELILIGLGLFVATCGLIAAYGAWLAPQQPPPIGADPTATAEPATTTEPTATEEPTATIEPSVEPTPQVVPTERVSPTAQAAPQQPTDTPASDVSTALFYNLPQTALNSPVPLYASPNRGDVISPAEIPVGEQVSVMARNPSSSHLRVVWNTGVGWIPVSFTDYNGQQQQLAVLPVFEHAPPACAVPITTQFNLNAEWTSDQRQRVAVVVDIFRSNYGTLPPSSLLLTVNGTPVESTRRAIVEHGQFALKGVVFSLPGFMQEGDVLGYALETTSDEPLTFIATIFSVPESCHWRHTSP